MSMRSLARSAVRSALGRVLYLPDPVADLPVETYSPAPPLPRDRAFTVLVWNLQFCGGRERHFFYDGGRDVAVPRDEVVRVMDAIGAALREQSADVVLLQEVDRGADRTARIDEHVGLLRRCPYPVALSAPYHRAPWVPVPSYAPMGRVELHLSVFSRFAVRAARRHDLPRLAEPRWRQQLNLKRCFVDARLPVEGGGEAALIDVHLSAFARGDGTVARQVERLVAHAASLDAEHTPWLVAGDLNALPPGDDPRRLADPDEYPEAETPIRPLWDAADAAVPRLGDVDPRWRTYLPPSATTPDRVLDYAFARGIAIEEATVVDRYDRWSDHRPLKLVCRVSR